MIETHADDNKTIKYLFTLHLKIFLGGLVYFQSKNALAMYRTPPGLEKVWVVTVAVRPPSDTTHSASSARASTHAVYTASSSAGLVPTISDLKQQR